MKKSIFLILLFIISCNSYESNSETFNTTSTTLVATTTTVPDTTTTVEGSQPPNPGNSKNCGDFSNYAEAKAWFDTYYPFYGDIGDLDRDEDLIPCESLSGAP